MIAGFTAAMAADPPAAVLAVCAAGLA